LREVIGGIAAVGEREIESPIGAESRQKKPHSFVNRWSTDFVEPIISKVR
jgi:hypothetical protein